MDKGFSDTGRSWLLTGRRDTVQGHRGMLRLAAQGVEAVHALLENPSLMYAQAICSALCRAAVIKERGARPSGRQMRLSATVT